MKRLIAVILVIIVVVLLFANPARASSLSSVTVAFGDSNTANSNFLEEKIDYRMKWALKLSEDRPVVNAGVAGNTTGMALSRIQSVVDMKPKTVTIMFGTNDAVLNADNIPKTSWKMFERNLNAMVDTFQANGTNVVLMTTLPVVESLYAERHDPALYAKYGGIRAFHDAYNDITRRVAAEQGTGLVDTYAHFVRFAGGSTDELLLARGMYDSTGTHMSAYGADILYRNLVIELARKGY